MNLIIPNNLKQITDNIDLIDGVILSLKDFSVNTLYQVSLDELNNLFNILKDKEVFITLNKNIENNELESLEKVLLELNNYKIKGVLYSDPAIVTFKDKLNYDLVWAQEHLTTNYETINYWSNFGVNYAYLSSDITLNEINTISNNTKVKLMANIFGYIPMFTSKRNLVKNYLKTFNIKDDSLINYIKKEGKIYPIIDTDHTSVFTSDILNGVNEYFNMNVSYFVINGLLIDNDKFSEVLKIINCITKENVKDSFNKIGELFENTNSIFLYKETISRVKR